MQNFGRIAPRECGGAFAVIACDKREAFAQGSAATKQSIFLCGHGFASLARNDVVERGPPHPQEGEELKLGQPV